MMLVASIFAVRNINQKISTRTFSMLAVLGELKTESDPRRQRAFETYLAGTYRAELVDDAAWSAMTDKDDDKEVRRLRELARRASALQPTADETAAAAYVVQPALDRLERKKDNTSAQKIFVILVLVGCGMAFFTSLFPVLMRPSGMVLSALGLAVVVRSGREISRLRAVIRLLIAWSPMAVFAVLAAMPSTQELMMESMVPAGIAVTLMAAGLVWTVLRPTRGPHDIVARTTIGVR